MTRGEPIAVEVVFSAENAPLVRRIELDGQWVPVAPGRHWTADDGWHVLVMLPDNSVRELCLKRESLSWEIAPQARGVI